MVWGVLGLILPVVCLLFLFLFARYVAHSVIWQHSVSSESAMEQCLANGELDGWFFSVPKRQVDISSPFGYTLRGVELGTPPGPDAPVAIFCHGITWTWHGMVKYVHPYVDRGFRVIAYDHRYHGHSGGNCSSLGHFEKHDLAAVIDAFAPEGSGIPVVLIGESLGAATILQYRGDDERIRARMCDCSFSTLRGVVRYGMEKMGFPRGLTGIMFSLGSLYSRIFAGFFLSSVSPLACAAQITSPVLVLHGGRDNLSPVTMAHEIFAELKKSPAAASHRLVVFDEATHARSILFDPVRYNTEVESFLDIHCPGS